MSHHEGLFTEFIDHWKILQFRWEPNCEYHICGIVELYSFDDSKNHLEFRIFDPRYSAGGDDGSLSVKIDTNYFANNDIHFDNFDCIVLCNIEIARNGRHIIIRPTQGSSIIRNPFGSYKRRPPLLIQYNSTLDSHGLNYEKQIWPTIRALRSYRRKILKREPEENKFNLISELRADTRFASFDIMCEILEDSFSIHHSTGQEDTDRGLRVLKVCDFSGHNSLISELNNRTGQFTLPIEESVLKIEIKGYEKPFSYSADTKSCSYLLIKGLNVVLEDNAQKLIKGTIDYNNNINNTIKFLPAAVDSIKFARFTDRRFKKMPTISPVANMALRHEDDQVKKTDNTSGASHPKAAIDIYSKNSTLTDDDRFDWLLRPEGLRETLKNGEVKSCHITKQKKFEIDPVLNKYIHCPFRATPACKIGWILDHYYAHLDAFQGRSFRIIGKIENHIPQDYQDFIDKDSKSIRFLLIITGQDGRSIPVLFFGEDAENFLGLTLEHILNNPNSIGERMSYLVDCGKDYNSLYIDLMIFGFHPESREHQNLNVWKGFGSEINFIK